LLDRAPDRLEPATPNDQGVTQAIWVTIRAPRDASPGEFKGVLRITAEGVEPVEAPVRLTVADWAIPDPKTFTTFVGMVQSPESVALQYGIPVWSEEHWKLLEPSFRLMGELGVKTLHIPLIRRTYFGNEHSMVRWIRRMDASADALAKEGRGWSHDFSVVERYLDLALKHLGKIPVANFYCWEPRTDGYSYNVFHRERDQEKGGMLFSILDPGTGQLSHAEGPQWGTPEVREFWRPVFDGLRKRLAERGLERSMMVGIGHDHVPSKECQEDLKAVAPDARWVFHRHPGPPRMRHGTPVGYAVSARAHGLPVYPGVKRFYGWKRGKMIWAAYRNSNLINGWGGYLPFNLRWTSEGALLVISTFNGFGRWAFDFWPVLKAKNRATINGRYPDSDWLQLGLDGRGSVLTAPGPRGAVRTVFFEMMRGTAGGRGPSLPGEGAD
jgi:hypothetical protein